MNYRRNERIGIAVSVFSLCLLFAGIGGWIANLVKLIGMDWAASVTGLLLARAIGVIVAPLGAVLGFF